MLQMILKNTKIDMLPLNALIIFPSILVFWFFLIWVHGGLLPLLQQFAHMMVLESELRVPVTQGLLLGRSEVRKVIILVLQCFLIQAECGKAPGCISSGKDPVRPLFKKKTKADTDSLLDSQFLCGSYTENGFFTQPQRKAPFGISNSIQKPEVMLILWLLCSGHWKTCCH